MVNRPRDITKILTASILGWFPVDPQQPIATTCNSTRYRYSLQYKCHFLGLTCKILKNILQYAKVIYRIKHCSLYLQHLLGVAFTYRQSCYNIITYRYQARLCACQLISSLIHYNVTNTNSIDSKSCKNINNMQFRNFFRRCNRI